ncbi:hypothetical protein AAG906_014041 [Vitis piasezkii]
MITDKKVANAMGGKTARACDNCLHKRARWYCGADDAFLCQACDASVHSANQLAERHERVRLQAASCKNADSMRENSTPAWHQGFTRKARSPRNVKRTSVQPSKHENKFPTPPPLVPEIGSEEASPDENEEQFLFRVPTFDPFVAELNNDGIPEIGMENDSKPLSDYGHEEIGDLDSLTGFLPSEMDLAEFAADVESYLGAGLDEDSCGIKGIGALDCEEGDMDACFGDQKVKVKEERVETDATFHLDPELDMTKELLAWNLDYESTVMDEEEHEEKMVAAVEMRRKISLSLNYEDVITAWASQGSPWTTGNRPEFDPNDYWPDYMGACPTNVHGPCGDVGGVGGNFGGRDGGREARVLRYREKRRTRLFSKKIRYEVRKLNAEKRPRMKGRFVKRASFAAGPCFPILNGK